jgi:hypothetical protein
VKQTTKYNKHVSRFLMSQDLVGVARTCPDHMPRTCSTPPRVGHFFFFFFFVCKLLVVSMLVSSYQVYSFIQITPFYLSINLSTKVYNNTSSPLSSLPASSPPPSLSRLPLSPASLRLSPNSQTPHFHHGKVSTIFHCC